MPATFPSYLEKGFILDGFRQQRRVHARLFETDSGFTLRSKRPGSAQSDVSFQRFYTLDEFQELEAFFANDCDEGAVSFTMAHPVTGLSATFTWAAGPDIADVRNEVYRVTFTLVME